jgi:hypothetical protein
MVAARKIANRYRDSQRSYLDEGRGRIAQWYLANVGIEAERDVVD